ncbi:flagellar protein, partial [Salmonella enterica subsp. enterica serovar Typhimurium]
IVNAKNNTVVTAMDKQEATSRIFTNINATILMDE